MQFGRSNAERVGNRTGVNRILLYHVHNPDERTDLLKTQFASGVGSSSSLTRGVRYLYDYQIQTRRPSAKVYSRSILYSDMVDYGPKTLSFTEYEK